MAETGREPRDYGDSLPWLEPVEADHARPPRRRKGGTGGRIMLVLMVGLLFAFVVAALVFWVVGRTDPDGPPGLIKAPEGPYKVPTDQVGGMAIEGQGDSTYATSQGDDSPSTIDLSALPEAPMTDREAPPTITTRPPAPAPVAAAPAPTAVATAKTPPAAASATPVAAPKAAPVAPKPAPVKAAPPKPEPVEPAATGGTIQLGAFSSEAKANAAWSSLSKRFSALAPLGKMVVPVAKDGATLYRLRASAGGQANAVCAKLRVAGESCSVVGN
jgi:hypothetical protein